MEPSAMALRLKLWANIGIASTSTVPLVPRYFGFLEYFFYVGLKKKCTAVYGWQVLRDWGSALLPRALSCQARHCLWQMQQGLIEFGFFLCFSYDGLMIAYWWHVHQCAGQEVASGLLHLWKVSSTAQGFFVVLTLVCLKIALKLFYSRVKSWWAKELCIALLAPKVFDEVKKE